MEVVENRKREVKWFCKFGKVSVMTQSYAKFR